eukprot:Hpha_TRINITY_DN23556_c0_g1::TRINITY_DN23556_c0_g1_i1::g.186359::m.186359
MGFGEGVRWLQRRLPYGALPHVGFLLGVVVLVCSDGRWWGWLCMILGVFVRIGMRGSDARDAAEALRISGVVLHPKGNQVVEEFLQYAGIEEVEQMRGSWDKAREEVQVEQGKGTVQGKILGVTDGGGKVRVELRETGEVVEVRPSKVL